MGIITRPQPKQRPDSFRLNPLHPLARGLVFAGLGGLHGGVQYQDHSLHRNHGTLTNMDPATDWVWSEELGRWALRGFTSNTSYVTLPQVLSSAPWTCAGWANPDRAEGGADHWAIACRSTNLDSLLTLRESGSVQVTDDSWTRVVRVVISVLGWHHWAAVCTGDGAADTVTMYRDGVSIGSDSMSGHTINYTRIDKHGKTYSSDTEECPMSDPLIYNRTLTPAEIRQLADPSNVMLSGLIRPPQRRVWPVSSGGAPVTNRRRRMLIAT